MNERIRQLAKEAGYYLYDLTETHECKTVETDSTDEWITLEKFAQLIVKECIAKLSGLVVVTNDAAFEKDPAYEKWNLALGHAELEIREHFRVE